MCAWLRGEFGEHGVRSRAGRGRAQRNRTFVDAPKKVLYQVILERAQTMLTQAAERSTSRFAYPARVRQEFERYL